MFQNIAIAICAVALVITAVILTRAIRGMLATLTIGQSLPEGAKRTDNPAGRTATMLKETFLHTRMLQWTWVGILHWFAFMAFLILSTAVATGFVQLFDPHFALPIIGQWFVYEWVSEFIGLFGALAIIPLVVYRQVVHPRKLGRRSRFFGSNFNQAYFVEFMVLLESSAILFIRAAEKKLIALDHPDEATAFHFPISQGLTWMFPDSKEGLENAVIAIAMVKVLSALIWLIVIATNLTMGVAWHRFTAWVNIWFKRDGSGRTALGALRPLTSGGKIITLDDVDELDESASLGVGKIEDFSWKGILDFTTCTECGRCQSQCPAWNTDKPLSPKLLIMGLRDHAYAKAPYLKDPAAAEGSAAATALLEAPLVGPVEDGEWFYNPPSGEAIIDEDVLWSCTSCGACVQQCPVDIEHLDHIVDMRRYQVLVESNFPSELNGLFKGLEQKGNPWNMSPSARLDWAKDLPFEVNVVGETIESLDEVDWLFWVGCAGAYEDRAKKTTRAVAELLDLAGISFGVLGNGETCTGDPARRAGNEFMFQGLAQQNVETFKEYRVKKVVSTCAHCFNTLKNEYKDFGIELEVVHHTQLLNRLVREGRLTPVASGAGAAKRSITYHDPCYLGRHNEVYSPPRELLQILPGAEVVEMPRNSERSFCCGAGGARMWMEENLGSRINRNRTDEAVATGADQIAVGCPFCRVMLSDGLTAAQADGYAGEAVEVLDVAQMLLASVKGEQATKLAPGQGEIAAEPVPTHEVSKSFEGYALAKPSSRSTTAAAVDVAQPEAKSASVSKPAEADSVNADSVRADSVKADRAGPAPETPAGGSDLFGDAGSMFDEPAAPAPAEAPKAAEAPKSDGSLFDDASSLFDTPATPATPAAEPVETPATTPASEPAAQTPEPTAEVPQADLSSGGSLFDFAAPAEAPAAKAEPAAEPEPAAKAEPAAEPEPTPAPEPASVDINSLGSLFDIEAPAPIVAAVKTPEVAQPEPATTVEPKGFADLSPITGERFNTAEGTVEQVEPESEAEPEPEPEPASAAEPESTPEPPTSSGATHTPRADVDINAADSLFDL
ncbi:MAG: (Fe-S)-binding protein [Nocardioides sp.]